MINNPLRAFTLILLVMTAFNSSFCNAQSEEQSSLRSKESIKLDLDYILSLDAAEKYSFKHRDWSAWVHTVSEEDTSKRYYDVVRAPYMMTFHWYDYKRDINFLAKVVDTFTTESWGIKYIAFNAKKIKSSKIKDFIDTIKIQYENGVSFDTLSAKYNPHNHNGEFHFVKQGDIVPSLDKKSREAKLGEIFSAYSPKYDYYYVVYKSKKNKPVRFRKFLITKYAD